MHISHTSSSNSRMASPMVFFGTRAPRLSKNESSVMMRSARRLALFKFDGSSLNGVPVSRAGLNIEDDAGFGESYRSDTNGLCAQPKQPNRSKQRHNTQTLSSKINPKSYFNKSLNHRSSTQNERKKQQERV